MCKKLLVVISLAAILALTGCAYPLALYSRDGSAGGQGEANHSKKTMSISVADKTYKGTYIFDDGSSYGTAFVPGSNTGQSFLRSSDGSSLRCKFRYIGSSGLGDCIDNLGKSYDMVIGSPK